MLPEDVLQQRWSNLESKLTRRIGNEPDADAILVFIGIREAGLPSKEFTEKEKADLRQMAMCTILTPARYYELLWVDDTGWPHFKQLQRIPDMSVPERDKFLKEHILVYAEKNKLL
jgi:hypothetical protein